MDSRYSKFLRKTNKYVRSLHLNEFQGPSSTPTPGLFGVSRGAQTYILPYPVMPKYEVTKNVSVLPESLTDIQNITKVPPIAPNETVQFSAQEAHPGSQIGFGLKEENLSDNEIDMKSFQKVPDNVLLAFENPTIDVQSVKFEPKEKKLLPQIGKGKQKVFKPTKHLMKFL